ncbi:MAG TPA: alpha-ketoglutarate-dependent dioxygenase AlkB [Rhodanobacteraceae bacterium]|nr:alpha-ketoglutarate-dependent dioxygenase AlkB [Rhodanobacteraceae bacterium]
MQRPLIPFPAERSLEPLALDGADVRYAACAFEPGRADALFAALRREIGWEQHRLHVFGREVASPRLSCWVGDAGAAYTYSRTRFEPRPWTPALAALREELATRFDLPFNSVLANLYRGGQDSMGWHGDDEPELGTAPVIASLSFGAVRRFRFRSRETRKVAATIDLAHGSLLVMRGATQQLYQHDLPKTAQAQERINLTFRTIRF